MRKPWRGSAEDRGARTPESYCWVAFGVDARARRGVPACGGGRRAGDSSPSPSPRSCSGARQAGRASLPRQPLARPSPPSTPRTSARFDVTITLDRSYAVLITVEQRRSAPNLLAGTYPCSFVEHQQVQLRQLRASAATAAARSRASSKLRGQLGDPEEPHSASRGPRLRRRRVARCVFLEPLPPISSRFSRARCTRTIISYGQQHRLVHRRGGGEVDASARFGVGNRAALSRRRARRRASRSSSSSSASLEQEHRGWSTFSWPAPRRHLLHFRPSSSAASSSAGEVVLQQHGRRPSRSSSVGATPPPGPRRRPGRASARPPAWGTAARRGRTGPRAAPARARGSAGPRSRRPPPAPAAPLDRTGQLAGVGPRQPGGGP